MATLQTQVQDITGSSNAVVADYLNRGANFVISSLPKHMLWAFTEETSFATSKATIASWGDNGGNAQLTSNGHGFVVTDRILISGSSSNDGIYIPIAKATNDITIPKAYVAQAVPGYVFKLTKFDTNAIHSVRRLQYDAQKVLDDDRGFVLDSTSLRYPTNTNPKYIVEGDSVIPIPFPSNKDEAKIIHLTAPAYADGDPFSYGEFDHIIVKFAAALDFTALASSTAPSWTDVSTPVAPTPDDLGAVMTISSTAPVLPTIDDVTLTLPSTTPTYTAPVLSSAAFSETFPSYISTVMGSLDYSSVDTSLTEEDTELVGSKLAKINAQIGEFSAQLRVNLESFQSQQADYNQKFAEHQLVVNNNFKEWAQNYTIAQQKFNEENVVYQAELQKAIKDVDLEQNDKTQQLQKFQGEMSIYTQSVNNEIKTYTELIAQAREKWAEESAKYQADLNRYSGEIQQNVQQTTNDARNAQQYMTAANTYFTMAMNDIKTVLATVPNVTGG